MILLLFFLSLSRKEKFFFAIYITNLRFLLLATVVDIKAKSNGKEENVTNCVEKTNLRIKRNEHGKILAVIFQEQILLNLPKFAKFKQVSRK